MRLSMLYEYAPLKMAGLPGVFNKLFKKQQDPGRPPSNVNMPARSGNQNTPMKPRHKKFFNAPRDGASLESGQTEEPMAKKNQRPTRSKFGQDIVPQGGNDDLKDILQ